MAGSLESRLGNLEELLIIIIIIVLGGGKGGPPPVGDNFASDTTRMEALMRLIRRPPVGDSFSSDISRLSHEAIESRLLEISAELTRLRAHEGELNARLKELRGNSPKSK
jgi:hypothetical protein